jgi:hypothetical protein
MTRIKLPSCQTEDKAEQRVTYFHRPSVKKLDPNLPASHHMEIIGIIDMDEAFRTCLALLVAYFKPAAFVV